MKLTKDLADLGKRNLIVEGYDESSLCDFLLKKNSWKPEFVINAEGYSNIKKDLFAILSSEIPEVIGFAIDYDYYQNSEETGNVWEDFKNQLGRVGISKLEYSERGFIEKSDVLKVGVFIFGYGLNPPGSMEDLILPMIKETPLKNYVVEATDNLQGPELKLFEEHQRKKVLIKTWRAWQKKPGISIGDALKKGLLQETDELTNFKSWLQNLYSND